MFRCFALCLGPALLSYVLVQLMGFEIIDADKAGDVMFPICGVLLIIGAVITGVFVGRIVYRAVPEPVWAKVLLTGLTFLAVAIGYLGITGFGGCLLIVANSGNL